MQKLALDLVFHSRTITHISIGESSSPWIIIVGLYENTLKIIPSCTSVSGRRRNAFQLYERSHGVAMRSDPVVHVGVVYSRPPRSEIFSHRSSLGRVFLITKQRFLFVTVLVPLSSQAHDKAVVSPSLNGRGMCRYLCSLQLCLFFSYPVAPCGLLACMIRLFRRSAIVKLVGGDRKEIHVTMSQSLWSPTLHNRHQRRIKVMMPFLHADTCTKCPDLTMITLCSDEASSSCRHIRSLKPPMSGVHTCMQLPRSARRDTSQKYGLSYSVRIVSFDSYMKRR